jgi:hypothetical protein
MASLQICVREILEESPARSLSSMLFMSVRRGRSS